jgi:hypothetical protein
MPVEERLEGVRIPQRGGDHGRVVAGVHVWYFPTPAKEFRTRRS